jgi:hypothetical protein
MMLCSSVTESEGISRTTKTEYGVLVWIFSGGCVGGERKISETKVLENVAAYI